MIELVRTDTSIVGRWWWTVDRWLLVAILLLPAIGAILVMAASPAVADRLGLDSFHFVRRQLLVLGPALAVIVAASMLSPLWVRRGAVLLFAAAMVMLLLTLAIGPEIKGAQRWLPLGGLMVQPSEFVKPALAVVAAWMLAEQARNTGFQGTAISAALMVLVAGMLLLQPDVGMAGLVILVWFIQAFIAGMRMRWVAGLAGAGAAAAIGAYAAFPHVASRIDRFLDPASGDSYQVDTALNAFGNGGLFGAGPGEGVIKNFLPDAHADFIFAVAGEEFGMFVTVAVVSIFAFVVLRGLTRLARERDMFMLLAAAGLLVQFGMQAAINMGVNMRLLPAKGMTLPFLSYGGSSLLALALAMGVVLALTCSRAGGNTSPSNALRAKRAAHNPAPGATDLRTAARP